MGVEERQREARESAEYEQVAGPLREFNAYPDGCPACGQRAIQAVQFCTGTITLPDGKARACGYPGQHLHLRCSCGRPWCTRTKDDPETKRSVGDKMAVLVECMKATVGGHRDEIIFTPEELAAVAECQLSCEPGAEAGSWQMTVARPKPRVVR